MMFLICEDYAKKQQRLFISITKFFGCSAM